VSMIPAKQTRSVSYISVASEYWATWKRSLEDRKLE
jgi:hypothetical protein